MPKNIKQTVHIKTNEENPEPMELVAQGIIDIANAFEKMQAGRLKQRAILLLIRDQTGQSLSDIQRVLDVIPKLKDIYTKELKKK